MTKAKFEYRIGYIFLRVRNTEIAVKIAAKARMLSHSGRGAEKSGGIICSRTNQSSNIMHLAIIASSHTRQR